MQGLPSRTMHVLLVAGVLLMVPGNAGAGPWSRLPSAVSRLQENPSDQEARKVLARAEVSLVRQAGEGRVAAVRMLLDAFQAILSPLPDASSRVSRVEHRIAEELARYGRREVATDPHRAGRAWALALELDPGCGVEESLAALLVPPSGPKPGQVWVSLLDGAELVWLPPFRFLMGCTPKDGDCRADERYLRWVRCPGFWVQRTEVTNGQYRRCVESGACTPPRDGDAFADETHAKEPVVNVTWEQAADYARWAGRRLPSESEWERAARGKRTDWRYPWGNYRMRERCNVRGTSGRDVWEELAPVASFPWTGWGVYDLAANAWEWCEDTYHENIVAAPKDGSAWVEGGRGRVIRGGSWRRSIKLARVSARAWLDPTTFTDDVGFRCVADPVPSIESDVLLGMARTAFPVESVPGRELDGTGFDPADRRYLERRALTWTLLEGRPWEALPRAVAILERDPSDPVASELFGRIEKDLLDAASRAEVGRLRDDLARLRAASEGTEQVAKRVARIVESVAGVLKRTAAELERKKDTAGARRCLVLAVELAPADTASRSLMASLVPGAGTARLWRGDGRTMVWIPAGSFLMGRSRGDDEAETDEQPAHTVHLEGFWLDRTEVTNAEYRRCVEAGRCTPPHKTKRYDDLAYADHPVLWVDWYQARAYASWAGKRLPSEAEWEYAARAGADTRYPWGADWLPDRVNAFGTKGADQWMGSAPVGSFPANRWGVLGMIGNAREWILDVYHPSYRDAPRDGRPWVQITGSGDEEPDRVLRGGSYLDFPAKLRVSQRGHRAPASWSKTTGFRCAADEQ